MTLAISIPIDDFGRMVLPKALRQQMHIHKAGHLNAELVGGELRLVPQVEEVGLIEKDGILIADFKRPFDAGAAIKADREERDQKLSGAGRSSRR